MIKKKNKNIPVALSGRTRAEMESHYVWNHTEDCGFIIFMFVLIGGTPGNNEWNDICWGRERSLCTDYPPTRAGASSQESSVSSKPPFPQSFPPKDKWEEHLKTDGSSRSFLLKEWKGRDWWEQNDQLEKNMENPPSRILMGLEAGLLLLLFSILFPHQVFLSPSTQQNTETFKQEPSLK